MTAYAKDVIFSFIQSIDLFNFLLKNHHRRVAIISWHIGQKMNLSQKQLENLVLAASLHDIGALTISERNQLIQMDIDNPHPHSRLGSYMLESFEPFEEISKIIYYHHWPYEKKDEYVENKGPVPIESFIIHLADRVDISINKKKPILLQTKQVVGEITSKVNTLFHPDVYEAFIKASDPDRFWLDIDNTSMHEILNKLGEDVLSFKITLDALEDFSYTISKIIDCRSKYTSAHSFGVSEVAYKIGQLMGKDEMTCRKLRIAGLLHDIGKIGIDTEILEKKGPLTEDERKHVQEHAYYTGKILQLPKMLTEIAEWATHHHETHQGKGYPDNIDNGAITVEMDILSYSDVFTALSEDRPYRKGLPLDDIIWILESEFKEKHGSTVFEVIKKNKYEVYDSCVRAIHIGHTRYKEYLKITHLEV